MSEKQFELYEYAKRVNELSPKNKMTEFAPNTKFKGMKLPVMEFYLGKTRVSLPIAPMKNPKKMDVSEFDCKRISFVRSAYGAYKCCQNQNLHLFQLEKVYLENKYVLKGVVGWKLPKKKFVQNQLKALVEGMKLHSFRQKRHRITWLAHLESEEEKSQQDQMELQKQGKEKRNYSLNKSTF